MIQVEEFLEHYGVKGMKWGSTQQQSLDRIFRVEAGTTSRRENLERARKALAKVKEEEELKKKRQNGSDFDESSIEDFLTKIGAVRFIDIAAQDQ